LPPLSRLLLPSPSQQRRPAPPPSSGPVPPALVPTGSSPGRPRAHLTPLDDGSSPCRSAQGEVGACRHERPEDGLQAWGRARAPGAAAAALGVERRRLTGGAMAPGEQRSPARQSQPSIYRGYGCFSPTSRGEEV
ncbi:hypothetical protein PVAP13_3NG052680, partial [Panicum virgatum]